MVKNIHEGAGPTPGKLVDFSEPHFLHHENNDAALPWTAMRLGGGDRAHEAFYKLFFPSQPGRTGVTDEQAVIISRKGILMDPHQQVGLKPRSAFAQTRGVPLPTPRRLSQLTYPLQGTVAMCSRSQNHFPSAWLENTFYGFTFLVVLPLLVVRNRWELGCTAGGLCGW